MPCNPIAARTLTRRVNPDSGAYTSSLALGSMQAATSWDIRFRFTLEDLGDDNCNGVITFQMNRDGDGWTEMAVAGGSPVVTIGLPATDYDKAFRPPVPGEYQYRVKVEYDGSDWFSSTGTASVYVATLDGVPNVEVNSPAPSGVVGGLLAASSADSLTPAGVVGSAVVTAEVGSHAPEGTVG